MRPVPGRRQQYLSGRQHITRRRTPRTGLPVTLPRLTALLQVAQRPKLAFGKLKSTGRPPGKPRDPARANSESLHNDGLPGIPAERLAYADPHRAALLRGRPADVPRQARQYLHNSPLRDCGRTPARTPHHDAPEKPQPFHQAAPAGQDGRPGDAPSTTCRAGEWLAWMPLSPVRPETAPPHT